MSPIHISRSPSAVYLHAKKRAERLRGKIDQNLYKGEAPNKKLVICFFENEMLLQNLKNMIMMNAYDTVRRSK